MNTSTEFAGYSALILGASTGIGLATARQLALAGAAVTIVSHDAASLDLAMKTKGDLRINPCLANAAVEADITRAIAAAVSFGDGRLTTLISAVAMHPYGDAATTTPAIWRQTMDTNLTSAFLLTHYGLPHLLKSGGGTVTYVASNQGSACQPQVCAYSTSKAALIGLARSVAVDFSGQGIRANTVSPGPVKTPMLGMAAQKFMPDVSQDEAFAAFGKSVPIGRIAEAEEVAQMICFLASPRASYCSGGDYTCDGALGARLGI